MSKLKLIAAFLVICFVCVIALKLGYLGLLKDAPSEGTVAQYVSKAVDFGNTSELRFERSGKMTRYFDGGREGVYLYTVKTNTDSFKIEVRWATKGDNLKIESIYRVDGMSPAQNLYKAP